MVGYRQHYARMLRELWAAGSNYSPGLASTDFSADEMRAVPSGYPALIPDVVLPGYFQMKGVCAPDMPSFELWRAKRR